MIGNASNVTAIEEEVLPVEELEGEAAEQAGALGLFVAISLLMGVLASGALLDRYQFMWISEAAVGLLAGLVFGLVVRFVDADSSDGIGGLSLSSVVNFDPKLFFLVLLPPIIFESGYCMPQMALFRFVKNFGAILVFAFIGTAVSAVLVGLICYGAGAVGISFPITLLDALLFGSLISATDPVTVLSIFQKVGADLNLWSLIYGESVLNDAVAIVLYTTLDSFKDTELTAGAVAGGVLSFMLVFFGSLIIGVCTALLVRLICWWRFWESSEEKARTRAANSKDEHTYGPVSGGYDEDDGAASGANGHGGVGIDIQEANGNDEDYLMGRHRDVAEEQELDAAEHEEAEYATFELSVLLLAPLAAYMLADYAKLSGIVAILFCGIAMARYARPVASPGARAVSIEFYRALAKIAETGVFVYMGTAVLIQPMDFAPVFFVVSLVACLVARACNIFPMVRMVNAVRTRKARAIPWSHKLMLWWAGLRGAIAFALALRFRSSVLARAVEEAAASAAGNGTAVDGPQHQAALESASFVGDAIFTTTALIVLTTVIVIGGTTDFLIRRMDLKEPVANEAQLEMLLRTASSGRNNGDTGNGSHHGQQDKGEVEMSPVTGRAGPSSADAGSGELDEYVRDVHRSKSLTLPWEKISAEQVRRAGSKAGARVKRTASQTATLARHLLKRTGSTSVPQSPHASASPASPTSPGAAFGPSGGDSDGEREMT